MIDILVYLLDQQFEDELIDTFKGTKYIYHHAASADEVIENCRQDFVDLILVWPGEVEIVADILTILNMKNLSHIPVVAAISKNMDETALLKLPVADIIKYPLPKPEFFTILDQITCELQRGIYPTRGQHWQGSLKEFSLVDIICLLEASNKDAVLEITIRNFSIKIFFHRGKVIGASLRDLEGLVAIQKLAGLRHGNFHIHFTRVEKPDVIKMSNRELIELLNEEEKQVVHYLETIPDINDDFLTLKFPDSEDIDSLKNMILKKCEEGRSVFELMLELDFDNKDILKAVQELIQDGFLVRSQDYDLIVQQESEQHGLSKLFNSLLGIFKRGKKFEVPLDFPVKTEKKQNIEKFELIYQPKSITQEEIHRIQKFLEEV